MMAMAVDAHQTSALEAWIFLGFVFLAGYLARIAVEKLIANRLLGPDPTMPKIGRVDWTEAGAGHILTWDAASGRPIEHATITEHLCGTREVVQYDFKRKLTVRLLDHGEDGMAKHIWIGHRWKRVIE